MMLSNLCHISNTNTARPNLLAIYDNFYISFSCDFPLNLHILILVFPFVIAQEGVHFRIQSMLNQHITNILSA